MVGQRAAAVIATRPRRFYVRVFLPNSAAGLFRVTRKSIAGE